LVRFRNKPCHLSRRVLWPAVLLLLALIPFANLAQEPGQSSLGIISGKVVDANSGAPLARCSVQIDPTGQGGQSGSARSVVTADDGQFIFEGVAPGKYRLSANKRGYLRQEYEEHENFSTAIAIGPKLIAEGLIFKVTPQAVISGEVTDQNGEPVRGAQVRLFKDQERMGLQSVVRRQAVVADDRGIYEIPNVGPGNYYLAVSAQPWYTQRMMRFDGGREDSSSELDVAYPTTFYAQVTNSDDATPIPIKGGERIQANVTLTAQQAMRLPIKLPLQEPAQDPSQDPAHSHEYTVVLSQSVFGQMEPFTIGMVNTPDGTVTDGILPGHYEVTVSQHGFGAPSSTRFETDVASGDAELTPVEAESEVTVAGKVSSLDGKTPVGGIILQPTNRGRPYQATLGPAGEFTVQVLPGDYEVIGQLPQMYLARIRTQDAELKDHVLPVKAGGAPKLEILASKGFGQIDGIVQRGDQPVSGVMVLLAPEDNRILFRRDQSDSDGTFSLTNIVPGRYRLLAIEGGWELEWGNRDVLNAFLKRSILVEVHANDKLTRTVESQSR
jgi:5-hydroxyisourate hydrolase-like protein (transthyretin family)